MSREHKENVWGDAMGLMMVTVTGLDTFCQHSENCAPINSRFYSVTQERKPKMKQKGRRAMV